LQGNEASAIGRDPWELLDAKADIAFLAIELVDTRQSAPRDANAAAAQHSAAAANEATAAAAAAAAAAEAADKEGGVSLQQQADVLSRAGPPTRLKLRWNNTNNVEIVMLQGDNTQEASSILPHVNTPGVLHCYSATML
jgi:imidazolonepropionase-like amidohydrolase